MFSSFHSVHTFPSLQAHPGCHVLLLMPNNPELPVWACKKGHVCLHWEWSSHAAAQSAALGGLGCPLPIGLYLPCAVLSLHYRSTQTETLAMGLQPDLAPALAEGPQVTEQHEISPRALPTALALNPCMASGLWHLLPPALLR